MKINNMQIIDMLEQKDKKELIACILILNMQKAMLKRKIKELETGSKGQKDYGEKIKS